MTSLAFRVSPWTYAKDSPAGEASINAIRITGFLKLGTFRIRFGLYVRPTGNAKGKFAAV
jgi:hypothetical protein